MGKADVEMDILGQKIGQEFLIANLDKVNLLGIDFLEKANAEINIKKQILKTSFGRFKLFRNKTNSCARIQVSETISIPPKSEYIFQTYVDKPFQGVGLVEPTKHLLSKGLHVARSLCDPIQGAVTVSVLNIREKPVTIERETVVGTIESVNSISINHKPTTNHSTQSNHEIPAHLQPMLDEIHPTLTESQKEQIKGLIFDNQDIFQVPGEKLGQTNITTHRIDTGDHLSPYKNAP